MKDYIELAFAKECIDIKSLELYRLYDLVTAQLYLYYSKYEEPRDKKLYLVSVSERTNSIGIFQAKFEKFNEFRITDLKHEGQ